MYNVYLISSEIDGQKLYKIGYTRREVTLRIKELKTGNAGNFDVIDIFKTKWGTKIEKILHDRFKSVKVNGEWFILNEEQIVNFRKICESSEYNFDIIDKYNTYNKNFYNL